MKAEWAYFAFRSAVSITCFVSAVWLIANGYEHGWGWLILIGFIVTPSKDTV